jgi:hypothetical protein
MVDSARSLLNYRSISKTMTSSCLIPLNLFRKRQLFYLLGTFMLTFSQEVAWLIMGNKNNNGNLTKSDRNERIQSTLCLMVWVNTPVNEASGPPVLEPASTKVFVECLL